MSVKNKILSLTASLLLLTMLTLPAGAVSLDVTDPDAMLPVDIIPDPSVEQTPDTQQSSEEVQQPQEQNTATEPNSGIPIVPLVVFLVGLACGGGGLVALHFAKRRHPEADYGEGGDEVGGQY